MSSPSGNPASIHSIPFQGKSSGLPSSSGVLQNPTSSGIAHCQPSSPVNRVAKPVAEHKRDEVQRFSLNNTHRVPFETSSEFMEFLGVPQGLQMGALDVDDTFTLATIVEKANAMAKNMKNQREYLIPLTWHPLLY
jgi:hypothetical protein